MPEVKIFKENIHVHVHICMTVGVHIHVCTCRYTVIPQPSSYLLCVFVFSYIHSIH